MYAAKLESLSKQREFLFKAVERTFRNSGYSSIVACTLLLAHSTPTVHIPVPYSCASLASEDGGGLADSRAATQPIGRREDGDDSPTSRPRTAIPSHVKDRPTSAGSVVTLLRWLLLQSFAFTLITLNAFFIVSVSVQRSATYEVQSLMTAEVTETNVERFMGIIEQHCIEVQFLAAGVCCSFLRQCGVRLRVTHITPHCTTQLCARARRQGLIDVSEDSEGSDAEGEDGSGQGKDKADSSDTRSDAKAASRNMVKGPDVPFQSNTFHVVVRGEQAAQFARLLAVLAPTKD